VKHVVMFSGGLGSWLTARRVKDEIMEEGDTLVLLFADTKMEDPDLYRFLDDAARDLDTEVTTVADGRNPFEVFRDVRYLGNTRVDPCSRVLKRELLRTWLTTHCTPEDTVIHLGIGWDESHRFEKAQPYWVPWTIRAPLCEEPLLPLGLEAHRERLAARGIAVPRLYDEGFPHNNCGGACVKAGKAQWALLLRTHPERYAYAEEQEDALSEELGKQVTILRERCGGGKRRRLSLRVFRERLQAGEELPEAEAYDYGGCACFAPETLMQAEGES